MFQTLSYLLYRRKVAQRSQGFGLTWKRQDLPRQIPGSCSYHYIIWAFLRAPKTATCMYHYLSLLTLVKMACADNRGNNCFHKMSQFKAKITWKKKCYFLHALSNKHAWVNLPGLQIRKLITCFTITEQKLDFSNFFCFSRQKGRAKIIYALVTTEDKWAAIRNTCLLRDVRDLWGMREQRIQGKRLKRLL